MLYFGYVVLEYVHLFGSKSSHINPLYRTKIIARLIFQSQVNERD